MTDKNNTTWVEVCEGHLVEATDTSDCACYSKNFSEALNKDLNVFASANAVADSVDFVLYGSLIGVVDYNPFVYIPYYIPIDDSYQLRMYIINKTNASIDNITIDAVTDKFKANVFLNDSDLVIQTETVTYKVGYNYVINANFEPTVLQDYKTNVNLSLLTVNTGQVVLDSTQCQLDADAQYSFLIYEYQLAISCLKNGIINIFNLKGQLLGTSVTDANAIYFFQRNANLISVEGHENYIRIKGVET